MSVASHRCLADVNLLFALVWPRHRHHSASHAWFAAQGHKGWASNAITQLGVVRLLTNWVITRDAVNASSALELLAEATSHPKHQFWPLDQPLAVAVSGSVAAVTGHRQWTDLLMLRQAADHNGVLVTFDAGLELLAGKELRAHLLVLRD